MIAGKDSPRHGEAKNSWLTGTAAWTFTNVSQHILGIRPEFNGLLIDPCIPSSVEKLKITRTFRNAKYQILILNPNGVEKGITSLSINGELIEGNLIPYVEGQDFYDIVAFMGN